MLPVALAAAVSLAPPALADQADDAFVSALITQGIIPKSLTADQALINGHAICSTMDKGIGQADMVEPWRRRTI